jgi:hypothetical protein
MAARIQQAVAHTIESQIPAPSERARSDGTLVPLERLSDSSLLMDTVALLGFAQLGIGCAI